jgi:transcriptional regulator with XRE-family HTH domain
MVRDPVDRWRDLGSFIREQRSTARLSLRRLSELAGISNPYLSQIERGLRRPSADILQQIAKALRISAETLYVQAGILDPPAESPDLVRHILADPHLGESQKQALVEIYLSFRRAGASDHEPASGHAPGSDPDPAHAPRPAPADPADPADAGAPPGRPGRHGPGGPGPAATDLAGGGGDARAGTKVRHGGGSGKAH